MVPLERKRKDNTEAGPPSSGLAVKGSNVLVLPKHCYLKIKSHSMNFNTHRYQESGLTAIRGEVEGGPGKKGERIKQRQER